MLAITSHHQCHKVEHEAWVHLDRNCRSTHIVFRCSSTGSNSNALASSGSGLDGRPRFGGVRGPLRCAEHSPPRYLSMPVGRRQHRIVRTPTMAELGGRVFACVHAYTESIFHPDHLDIVWARDRDPSAGLLSAGNDPFCPLCCVDSFKNLQAPPCPASCT